MKNLKLTLFSLVILAVFGTNASAALLLRNGDFDLDPDLGSADDSSTAPTFWFTGSTVSQSWNDFRFGNNGNGAWGNNGIALGQDFLGPNFDPGPEVGYFYTSLGAYAGEVSAALQGFAYNRVNGNDPGHFEVAFIYTRAGTFTGADGADVASAGVQLSMTTVDATDLRGNIGKSQLFDLITTFGQGIKPGDEIWLRIGDGPDNGDLNTFDEPIIDNLGLSVVVPEPSSFALAGMGLVALTLGILRRRRTNA